MRSCNIDMSQSVLVVDEAHNEDHAAAVRMASGGDQLHVQGGRRYGRGLSCLRKVRWVRKYSAGIREMFLKYQLLAASLEVAMRTMQCMAM